jgi:7-carboxy-7-deazaguanine synthase (Cx14CxxC type)
MAYTVKEIYYTLQGEGAQAGRPAVFCRFSGCNLWTGREQDRRTAVCAFCDTDFVGTDGPGGGKFDAPKALAAAAGSHWPTLRESGRSSPLVVCTGGEPLLQLDRALIDAFHREGFEIAVETNGTRVPPEGLDWICVSPKAGAELVLRRGNELKLVYPQTELMPDSVADLDFDVFFLQPMDGPQIADNTRRTIEYVLAHPQWRLSLQTHKILGIQ